MIDNIIKWNLKLIKRNFQLRTRKEPIKITMKLWLGESMVFQQKY